MTDFIVSEDVQITLSPQIAFGTPVERLDLVEAYTVPRGSSFDINIDGKLNDNEEVQADGIERAPGRGDNTADISGDIIVTMHDLPYYLYLWGGAINSILPEPPDTFDQHVITVSRNTIVRQLELGLIPLNLYYPLPDYILSEIHLALSTNANCKLGTKWQSTGKPAVMAPTVLPTDSSPTTLIGPTVDYNDLVLFENAVDGGDIKSMQIDCVAAVAEKRTPSNGGTPNKGVASALRMRTKKVSGKIVVFFESDARAARVRSGTLTSLKCSIADTDGNTAVGEMKEVVLQKTGWKLSDNDGVMQEYTFKSIRHANLTQTPIMWTCLNPVPSYPV